MRAARDRQFPSSSALCHAHAKVVGLRYRVDRVCPATVKLALDRIALERLPAHTSSNTSWSLVGKWLIEVLVAQTLADHGSASAYELERGERTSMVSHGSHRRSFMAELPMSTFMR